jgi:hypothetical protein
MDAVTDLNTSSVDLLRASARGHSVAGNMQINLFHHCWQHCKSCIDQFEDVPDRVSFFLCDRTSITGRGLIFAVPEPI